MPQLFLMVIVAVALHSLLGWPLLAGIVIVAAILTVPGLIKLFAQVNDENRPAVLWDRDSGTVSRTLGFESTRSP